MRKSRKERALVLLADVRRGPSLHASMLAENFTVEEAENQVRLWLKTWIEPEIIRLIPELKGSAA